MCSFCCLGRSNQGKAVGSVLGGAKSQGNDVWMSGHIQQSDKCENWCQYGRGYCQCCYQEWLTVANQWLYNAGIAINWCEWLGLFFLYFTGPKLCVHEESIRWQDCPWTYGHSCCKTFNPDLWWACIMCGTHCPGVFVTGLAGFMDKHIIRMFAMQMHCIRSLGYFFLGCIEHCHVQWSTNLLLVVVSFSITVTCFWTVSNAPEDDQLAIPQL